MMRRHLGTTVGAGLLSLALLTSLSGCLQTAQTPQATQTPQAGTQGESQLANHAIRPYDNRLFSSPGLSWDSSADGKGFYVPQSQFLNYYDPEVGTLVPLCSQSGCSHSDQSCEAYLADDTTGFVDYNGTWYVMGKQGTSAATLWKVDPKTHQRTKVYEVAGKEEDEGYYFSSGFISHGYAYLDLNHSTMGEDGHAISDNYMLRVQLDTGEAQFLFENQLARCLGAGEDRVLISVPDPTSLPLSEKEYLEQNPGGDYVDYVRTFYANLNPADEVKELRVYTADLSSYQVLAKGYIRGNMVPSMAHWGDLTLYAVGEELYLYNLATGEQRQIEFQGTLLNFYFTDGRIFIYTHDPGLKVYYTDVKGGPTYTLENEGNQEFIVFGSSGECQDYVYGLYSGKLGDNRGLLTKEDFFAERYENLIPVSLPE